MGRPRRIEAELTSVKFFLLLAPSEYLELRDAAEDADETMAEYVRRALARRYEADNPHRLAFGSRFRLEDL